MDKRDLELLAYGLLGGKGNLGQNLSQAGLLMLQDRDQRKDRETRQKQQDIASQLTQLQLQQAQQQMADQGNIRQAFERNYQAPQAQQTAPFQADTFPGEAPIGGLSTITQQARPAGFNMQGLQADLMAAGPAGFQEAARVAQMQQKQGPRLEKLGPNEIIQNLDTGEVVARGMQKPESETELAKLIREQSKYQPNTTTYKAYQQRIEKLGKAEGTTVNVMPPQKTFDNSFNLKKDFAAQPEVKAFKEIQFGWDQIRTALQNPSAANDLAAATKFMKLLDPGSVVRESELIMAMEATGKLDQFMNYANRLKTGQKLTPSQRKDFYAAGEALYNASLNRYSQTAQQYQGIADKYGLDKDFLPKTNATPNLGALLDQYAPQGR